MNAFVESPNIPRLFIVGQGKDLVAVGRCHFESHSDGLALSALLQSLPLHCLEL